MMKISFFTMYIIKKIASSPSLFFLVHSDSLIYKQNTVHTEFRQTAHTRGGGGGGWKIGNPNNIGLLLCICSVIVLNFLRLDVGQFDTLTL